MSDISTEGGYDGGAVDLSMSTYVAMLIIWVVVLLILIFDKWFLWVGMILTGVIILGYGYLSFMKARYLGPLGI